MFNVYVDRNSTLAVKFTLWMWQIENTQISDAEEFDQSAWELQKFILGYGQ